MNLTEWLCVLVAMIIVTLCWSLYWVGWLWVMHIVWPNGPQWFVRPALAPFICVSFLALIFTLVIIRTDG